MSDDQRFFTWAEFDKLSAPQANLITVLYEDMSGQSFPLRKFGNPSHLVSTEDEVDSVLDLYADGDGCVPSHHADGEDLASVILRKFRGPVDAAIYLVETELVRLGIGEKYTLRRVIQPSHDDECKVVVLDRRDGYPFVYFAHSSKAWHYVFKRLAELADEVENIRARTLRTYRYLHNNRDFKLPIRILEDS